MNKLPMTVWLDRHAAGVQTLGFYSPNKECLHVEGNMTTFGPYVHLDQFLAEVEAEAQACADEGLSYDTAFVDIIRDKQKELDK